MDDRLNKVKALLALKTLKKKQLIHALFFPLLLFFFSYQVQVVFVLLLGWQFNNAKTVDSPIACNYVNISFLLI